MITRRQLDMAEDLLLGDGKPIASPMRLYAPVGLILRANPDLPPLFVPGAGQSSPIDEGGSVRIGLDSDGENAFSLGARNGPLRNLLGIH